MDQNLMFNYVCRGEVSSSSIYFSAQWTSVFHIEVVQASDFHVLIEEFVENASTCGRVGIGNERKWNSPFWSGKTNYYLHDSANECRVI